MDMAVRLVERAAAFFSTIAANRKPALPDPFLAGLIRDALRGKANLPEQAVPAVAVPPPTGPNKGRWKQGVPYRDAIIAVLRKFPSEGLTWDAVQQHTGLKRGQVFKQLKNLFEAGVVSKKGGVYRLIQESQWGGPRPNSGPNSGGPGRLPVTRQRQAVIDVLVAAGSNGITPLDIAAKLKVPRANIHQQLLAMNKTGQASRRSAGIWIAGDKGQHTGPEERRKPVPGGRRIPGRPPKSERLPVPAGDEAEPAKEILTAVGLGIRPAAPEHNGHYVRLLVALRKDPDRIFTPQLLAPVGGYGKGTTSGGIYSAVAKFVDAGLLERVQPGHYKLGAKGR